VQDEAGVREGTADKREDTVRGILSDIIGDVLKEDEERPQRYGGGQGLERVEGSRIVLGELGAGIRKWLARDACYNQQGSQAKGRPQQPGLRVDIRLHIRSGKTVLQEEA